MDVLGTYTWSKNQVYFRNPAGVTEFLTDGTMAYASRRAAHCSNDSKLDLDML